MLPDPFRAPPPELLKQLPPPGHKPSAEQQQAIRDATLRHVERMLGRRPSSAEQDRIAIRRDGTVVIYNRPTSDSNRRVIQTVSRPIAPERAPATVQIIRPTYRALAPRQQVHCQPRQAHAPPTAPGDQSGEGDPEPSPAPPQRRDDDQEGFRLVGVELAAQMDPQVAEAFGRLSIEVMRARNEAREARAFALDCLDALAVSGGER